MKGNHRTIAENGLILRVTVGSTLHGLEVDGQDDRDEMGICIPPPECVLGLTHFEHYVERTQPQGVRSGPGDLDYTCYSAQKWCRLALNGNPTVLLPLFAPNQFVLQNSEIGQELRDHASWFASRRAGKAFLGYLQQQRGRLTGDRGQKRCNRPELIEKYTFDVKYASHVIRLGCQGNEYLRTGQLTLPMMESERDMIKDIRRGKINLSDVLIMAAELEESLRKAIASTSLPNEPDYDAVNTWLVYAHQRFWNMSLVERTMRSIQSYH
jgi:predicted nucleotidyltransferase